MVKIVSSERNSKQHPFLIKNQNELLQRKIWFYTLWKMACTRNFSLKQNLVIQIREELKACL